MNALPDWQKVYSDNRSVHFRPQRFRGSLDGHKILASRRHRSKNDSPND